MATRATVRTWSSDEGWGVLDCADTPGGCWAHFSAVAVPGYRELSAGQGVELEWEVAEQDGYAHRATRVWPVGTEPYDTPADPRPSAAYRSDLRLTRRGRSGG